MAYRRRRRYRRRRYPRRRSAARKRARIIRRAPMAALKSAIHLELKRHFKDLGSVSCDTTGAVIPLVEIPFTNPGRDNERIGRDVRLKGINLKFILKRGSAMVDPQSVTIRVIVDRRTSGAAHAVIGDIYRDITSYGHNSWLNRGRFRTIKEWKFVIGGSTVAAL